MMISINQLDPSLTWLARWRGTATLPRKAATRTFCPALGSLWAPHTPFNGHYFPPVRRPIISEPIAGKIRPC